MSKFEITQQGVAGTLESSDLQVLIDKNLDGGIQIELESSVIKQYGEQIKRVVQDTLNHLGVTSAKLVIKDQGALDCTIRARVIAAVHRASNRVGEINWEELETWNV